MLPGREGPAAGGRSRLTLQEPIGPASQVAARGILCVGRLALVADEPIRPEIGDPDLQAVRFGFDRLGNIDAPGIAPDDAEVAAVEPDSGDILDRSQVEPEATALRGGADGGR